MIFNKLEEQEVILGAVLSHARSVNNVAEINNLVGLQTQIATHYNGVSGGLQTSHSEMLEYVKKVILTVSERLGVNLVAVSATATATSEPAKRNNDDDDDYSSEYEYETDSEDEAAAIDVEARDKLLHQEVRIAAIAKDSQALDALSARLKKLGKDLNLTIDYPNNLELSPLTHLAMEGKVAAVNFLEAYDEVDMGDAVTGYAVVDNQDLLNGYDLEEYTWPLIFGYAAGNRWNRLDQYLQPYAESLLAKKDLKKFIEELATEFILILKDDERVKSDTVSKYVELLTVVVTQAMEKGQITELQAAGIHAHIKTASDDYHMVAVKLECYGKIISAAMQDPACSNEEKMQLANSYIELQLDLINVSEFKSPEYTQQLIEGCLLNIAKYQSHIYYTKLNRIMKDKGNVGKISNVKFEHSDAVSFLKTLNEHQLLPIIEFLKVKV